MENSKLFMLCRGDKLVGFEMAQISKEDDRIVGWKPWMYIQKEFRNATKEFINEKGETNTKNVALQLDANVENWFAKNGANYQKTCTGINMLANIITYIGLGFKPVSKTDKNIFLEKDMKNPLSKQEIRDLIKKAKQGNLCEEQNVFKNKWKSSISLEKQKSNSEEFIKIQGKNKTNVEKVK